MMVYYAECSIIVGLGQSIFAAYIFFVFLEFLPKIFLAYDESYQEKCSYELLRLLLLRLDDLFLEPFKQVYTEEKIKDINIEKFFSEEVLLGFLCKFDIKHAKSNAIYLGNDGKRYSLTFLQYAKNYWNEVQKYIGYLLNIPYIRENNELFSQLQYLKLHSSIFQYFKLVELLHEAPISYDIIIGNMQDATGNYQIHKETIKSIVRLHQIAFNIYIKIMNDQRWGELFPPPFYENSL